jgi:transcription factor IIIB subunit 2
MEGKIICKFCGFLLDENISNPDISFEGKEKKIFSLNGQLVRRINSDSFSNKIKFNDLVLSSARRKINQLAQTLKLKGFFQDEAYRIFILATQKGFINRQKLQNLCVSSLYVVCRQKKTHHLLVDFSDVTQIQTNRIGSVFLKFIRDLKIKIPVIDPSLYIHRFVSRLNLGNKTKTIALSALRLMARMKREWVSTGRRPSGLCGAAILLAAKMHGLKKTQKEISNIVRIGDFAIRSRLREINKTTMSNLTIKDIDYGGGDDGSGSSLFKASNALIHPPSMGKIFPKKKFEK